MTWCMLILWHVHDIGKLHNLQIMECNLDCTGQCTDWCAQSHNLRILRLHVLYELTVYEISGFTECAYHIPLPITACICSELLQTCMSRTRRNITRGCSIYRFSIVYVKTTPKSSYRNHGASYGNIDHSSVSVQTLW